MNILNVSKLKINDSHSYYGGAIGNIAYNQMAALATREGVNIHTTVDGVDFEGDVPAGLSYTVVGGYDEVEDHTLERLDSADVVTHLYFHEPEYNPVSKVVDESEVPFVIGMCEVPHPRFRDEVSGIQRLPLVRRIGKRFIMPRFKRTLRRADRLVVVDEHAKEYYGRYYPAEQIEVVPYGVECDRFTPQTRPETPRILMVNRLIERRGVDHMIAALPAIQDAVPDVELHIVGDGPRRERLERDARDLGVHSAITFHGNVSSDRLVDLYANATFFAHLSYADGWNQPALEAMASGRPVLCTDEPHNSMVVDGETGFKVAWASPEAVADASIEILTEPGLATSFGDTGRMMAEARYDWASIAEAYQDILERTIES